MKHLEKITTKYLVISVFFVSLLIVFGYIALVNYKVTTLDNLSKYVDTIFKSIAILAGAIWTLNRFFIYRTDYLQLQINDDVSIIKTSEKSNNQVAHSILLYRLDVVNTGKSLIPPFQQYIRVESIIPTNDGIEYQTLYRWPSSGYHFGNPIEPGSWSAVNNAILIPINTVAIRLYIELQLPKGQIWNWHKSFAVHAIKDKS